MEVKVQLSLDNLLIVKDCSKDKVEKVVNAWLKLYAHTLPASCWIKGYFKNDDFYIQLAPQLSNELFFFLVNYVKYNKEIGEHTTVLGYTIGKDKKSLRGTPLQVYLDENDTEYDNVFVVTSTQKAYKIDFGGKISTTVTTIAYQTPFFPVLEEENKLNFNLIEIKKRVVNKEARNIVKRFKIVSMLFTALYIANYVFVFPSSNFLEFNEFLGLVLTGWLFADYTLLQDRKMYRACFVFVTLVFLYGLYANAAFGAKVSNPPFVSFGNTLPLIFLLYQRPVRWIFIKVKNREPEVNNDFANLANFIYIIILILLTFGTLFLYLGIQ